MAGIATANEGDRAPAVALRRAAIFSGLVLVVGSTGASLGGDPTALGLGFLIWGAAPMVVCLAMRAVTRDWSDFGVRPGISRHRAWYVISVLAMPLAIGAALAVGGLTSSSSMSASSWRPFVGAVGPASVIYLVFALFEEVGWRGYLAPKLYSSGMNVFAAHAGVALVWASWHAPYLEQFSSHTAEGMATFLPRFLLGIFAFSIVLGELRMVTASFWPAVLMHWVGNTLANPLLEESVALQPGREFVGSPGADGLVVMACLALLGIGANRWRRSTEMDRSGNSERAG